MTRGIDPHRERGHRLDGDEWKIDYERLRNLDPEAYFSTIESAAVRVHKLNLDQNQAASLEVDMVRKALQRALDETEDEDDEP